MTGPAPRSPHIPGRAIKAAILWDFDGTVYRAPGACRRYGEEIALSLAPGRRQAYLATLDRYLSGQGGLEAADGWEAAVKAAAEQMGSEQVGPGQVDGGKRSWERAFRKAREYLESGECPVEVPAGLAEAVARLRPSVRQILLSNTPAFGVFGFLKSLGIAELFDEVVCEAAKPAFLPARLRATAEVFGLPMRALLSVGDHFANDIAPAMASGATAAYVNAMGAGPSGVADLEAPSLEELLPAVERWTADAAGWATISPVSRAKEGP
ncbi:MAG: HAD family hydrolase [Acidimicrobiales bacterium]